MYPMIDSVGWNYSFIALWALHILSVVAFSTGVLFFIVLAIRTFTPAQLKNSAIWLMVVGTIVCLITIAFIGRPWTSLHYGNFGMSGMQMQRMNQMMEMMTEHNRGANSDEQGDHGGMMQMMRMMMGSPQAGGGMMNTSGDSSIDITDNDNSSDVPQDEHHESSSSISR